MKKSKSLFEIRDKIVQAQADAARNPDHPINDGLRKYFEERKRKLAILRSETNNLDH